MTIKTRPDSPHIPSVPARTPEEIAALLARLDQNREAWSRGRVFSDSTQTVREMRDGRGGCCVNT